MCNPWGRHDICDVDYDGKAVGREIAKKAMAVAGPKAKKVFEREMAKVRQKGTSETRKG